MGGVTGDLTTNMDQLRTALQNKLDVVLFPFLNTMGFDKFLAMTLLEQRKKIWSILFPGIAWNNSIIETVRNESLLRLKKADSMASEWLATYHRIWREKAMKLGGQDFTSPYYYFSAPDWDQFTSDPIDIYAGRPISPFEQIRFPDADPLLGVRSQNKRGASLLRLALQRSLL